MVPNKSLPRRSSVQFNERRRAGHSYRAGFFDRFGFNRVRGVPLATQDIVEAINQLVEGNR